MIDAKQWLISSRPWNADGFEYRAIRVRYGTPLILSHHEGLRIRASDDGETILLGQAWSCDGRGLSPLSAIAGCKTPKEVEAATDVWSGRWVLIHHGRLYMDATGLMGVFIAPSALSSSISLLDRHLGRRTKIPPLSHGIGLDFFPGPLTPQPDTRRLMPGQGFDLATWSPFPRPLIRPIPFVSEERTISEFLRAFRNMLLVFLDDWKGNILLPLTAGRDSRTLMSLLEYSKIDYGCYTFDHPEITIDDFKIPAVLADLVNREYHFIRCNSPIDSKQLMSFDFHCGGLATTRSRLFYSLGQFSQLPLNSIALQGNVWEVAAEGYGGKIKNTDVDGLPAAIERKYINVKYQRALRNSIAEYAHYVKSTPQEIRLADRVYIEQRMGSWASSTSQALDIVDKIEYWNPVNCRLLLALLLSIPPERRIGKAHQERIISAACPMLLSVPFQTRDVFAHNEIQGEFIRRPSRRDYRRDTIRALGFAGYIKEALVRKLRRVKGFAKQKDLPQGLN